MINESLQTYNYNSTLKNFLAIPAGIRFIFTYQAKQSLSNSDAIEANALRILTYSKFCAFTDADQTHCENIIFSCNILPFYPNNKSYLCMYTDDNIEHIRISCIDNVFSILYVDTGKLVDVEKDNLDQTIINYYDDYRLFKKIRIVFSGDYKLDIK
jgi:hypothetical protein